MKTPLDLALARARGEVDHGHLQAAVAFYREPLQQWPHCADAWYELGWVLRRLGAPVPALDAYARAIAEGFAAPADALLNRAVVFDEDLADSAAAERELLRALRHAPEHPGALLNLGKLLEDRGDPEAAAVQYARLVESAGHDATPRRNPTHALDALARWLQCVPPQNASDPRIARLIARAETLPAEQTTGALFALGHVFERLDQHEQAFGWFERANAAAAVGVSAYRPEAVEAHVTAVLAAPPAPYRPRGPLDEAPLEPLFICGMFRSGSTLLEQVLNAHSEVMAGGELDLFPRLGLGALHAATRGATLTEAQCHQIADRYRKATRARAATGKPSARYFTDKRPDNLLLLGLVTQIFPHARVLLTRRDPVDTGLSVYQQHLDPRLVPYGTDLAAIGHYIHQSARLSDHWRQRLGDRCHVFDYDAFVRAPEPNLRSLLAWLDLDWEPACLAFHRQRNAVRTASYAQVRQPLHARSSGRWRRYETQLAPLLRALEPN